MKIVHLFNSSVISGPETLVVPSLAKLDLECEVIWLTETRLERAQSVAEYSEQYGLPTVSIPVERRFDRKAIKTLREQLSRGAIDIIHAHDVKASFYALKAVSGLTPRPKLVSTHHGVRGRAGFVSRLYERIYRHLVLPHFDLVLAVCASDRAILEISAGLVDKVRVHWNGVDAPLPLPFHREKRRSELHRQWGVPEEPGSVVVGIVGRLAPEKRVDYALSVFGEVKRRNPDLPLYFVVVGDGPLREELESQVKTQSLMNCVHFLGYRVDFGAEMVGLDVLLSLSRAEGLPINVLEAGYSKTPLLCTRIDGLADLFPFGTGFPALESSAGLPELVDELEKLIRDRELRHRIGERFFDRVNQSFSGNSWRNTLKDYYLQVFSK